MTAPAQFNHVIGRLAKVEATPYTAETLSNSTDGCDIYIGDGDPPPPSELGYIYGGETGNAWGTLAPQRNTTPAGQMRGQQYQVQPKGLGSAYGASARPPVGIHRHLQASGFDATYSATPTPQWTFTPTAANSVGATLTTRDYMQGSQYDMYGVICDLAWQAEDLGVPVMTFTTEGIANDTTDQSLPAITVDAPSLLWPTAQGMVLNLGAFATAIVRKVSYKRNRQMNTRRIRLNAAGGYLGNIPGRAAPEFEIEIERPARSTWDPEAIAKAGTVFATDVTIGSTQYNRWKHSFANSQIKPGSVRPGNDGGLAIVTFTVRAVPSTPAANDYESILFN